MPGSPAELAEKLTPPNRENSGQSLTPTFEPRLFFQSIGEKVARSTQESAWRLCLRSWAPVSDPVLRSNVVELSGPVTYRFVSKFAGNQI